jgi:hypothetical protein
VLPEPPRAPTGARPLEPVPHPRAAETKGLFGRLFGGKR